MYNLYSINKQISMDEDFVRKRTLKTRSDSLVIGSGKIVTFTIFGQIDARSTVYPFIKI